MTEPISRTELFKRVDTAFHEAHPDAPARLDDKAPDQAAWRQAWLETCEKMLNEEVDRVYWDRYPDAPLKLSDHDQEHAKYRRAWLEIQDEVMLNTPDLSDQPPGPADGGDGELDLSHLRAAVNQAMVEELPSLKPQLHDVVHLSLEEAIAEVQRAHDAGYLGTDPWETQTYTVSDADNDNVARFSVRAWRQDGVVTGSLSITIDNPVGP